VRLSTGRVLVNIDADGPRGLINSRLACVAVFRAAHEAQIYTNDARGLAAALSTEHSKTSAVEFRHTRHTKEPDQHTGVTTPNVKNRTLRPVAQICCQRKSNGNRLLQRRLQGFRPLPPTVHKRSFLHHPGASIGDQDLNDGAWTTAAFVAFGEQSSKPGAHSVECRQFFIDHCEFMSR